MSLPATVRWIDWDEFIIRKEELETSTMTPIDVPIAEPEPQVILQLNPRLELDPNAMAAIKARGPRTLGRDDISESGRQKLLPERMRTHSHRLIAIFRDAFSGKIVNFNTARDGSVVFLRPYKAFVHFEKELRAALRIREELAEEGGKLKVTPVYVADKEPGVKGLGVVSMISASAHDNGNEDLLHLRCFMKFFDDEIKPGIEYIDSDQCRKVHFQDLWHLFKPGDEVIDQTENQAYRVVRVRTPRHKVSPPWELWYKNHWSDLSNDLEKDEEDAKPVTIFCAYIDFDGKQLGPVSNRFHIAPFGGLKDIHSLPIYPLRLAKKPNLRNALVQRGRNLLSVSNFKSMYYMGLTIDTHDEIDSQVVVDFHEALVDETRKDWVPRIESLHTCGDTVDKEYRSCNALCCRAQSVFEDEQIDTIRTKNFLKGLVPDTAYRAPSLALSPHIFHEQTLECSLMKRFTAQLDLTFLRNENTDAHFSTLSAFDRLELPQGHIWSTNDQTDLVKGKGKGLILLLHGAPGVGKTTTAEGIAELFKKPLFQITCGDLGTTPREVERALEHNFALASRWGCILLLDEADVFLSARERKDCKRNGLVSVFLRVLEYYAGILFLTPNRIGDFDEAFASRINISLYYPELDETKTKNIFKLNLDLIEESLGLAEFDAHGKDIELQVDKGVPVQLRLDDFKTIQRAYLDFGNYLGDVRGTKGDRRAIDYGLRARNGTAYQTKPSRFSASAATDGRDGRYHAGSDDYAASFGSPNLPPDNQINDTFRPLVYQGGGGERQYGEHYMPNLTPGQQRHKPYAQHRGPSEMAGEFDRYETSPDHGYAHPYSRDMPRQTDPRSYQLSQQDGQNWAGGNPGMRQDHPPPRQSYDMQGAGQNNLAQPQHSFGKAHGSGALNSPNTPGAETLGHGQHQHVEPRNASRSGNAFNQQDHRV
ncbi:hypothetical protein GGR57DRAFT_514176 [Xylariaceae sp. FL1272]|nr:hypothetical protein GGR57DRAFT_514176 [Xylariaceae sp. FL1272]